MRNIYTAVEVGSSSIKIVVAECILEKYHVLASSITELQGVRRGVVEQYDLVEKYLLEGIEKIEKQIGFKINKVLLSLPSSFTKIAIEEASVKIEEELVSSRDVKNVLDKTGLSIDLKHELISVVPISFSADKKKNIKDPKGMLCKKLGAKAIVISAPRKAYQALFSLFLDNDIEIIDITLNTIADYYQLRNENTDKSLSAIINIGEDLIEMALFNKGIIIKTKTLNLGSKNVDRDITYVYGVDLEVSRSLKEKYACASRKISDTIDTMDLPSLNGGTINISQKEITEIVEARIKQILNISKNMLNDLTKRKISYIIITGGLSQIPGMELLIEEVFGIDGSLGQMNELGVRQNSFSTTMGMIKYYHEKMKFSGFNYSMINEDELHQMMNVREIDIKSVDDKEVIKASDYFIQ